MTENLMKAITEELEFECEIGDYKVSCQSADTNRLIISIVDNDNELDVTTADVRIGTACLEKHPVIEISYKKSIYRETAYSFGVLIDNVDNYIKWIKGVAIKIIKTLD